MHEKSSPSHLWQDVVSAVINKKAKPQDYWRVYIGSIEAQARSPVYFRQTHLKTHNTNEPKASRNYYLSGKLIDIYFTKREAQCMVLLMQGYTNSVVAYYLCLSPRTVEYYIKNMRQKVNANSKAHLIELVCKTDFLLNIDFKLDELLEKKSSPKKFGELPE